MVLRLALNYGSREEILSAVRGLLARAASGQLTPQEIAELDEESFRRCLYDPEMTDPDLLVRTGGELRLSNFLLWQASYTELWITNRLWPDFDVPDLETALRTYSGRERKYGSVGPGGEGESGGESGGGGPSLQSAVGRGLKAD
jgi:undecaprenyl diphosphate synthase